MNVEVDSSDTPLSVAVYTENLDLVEFLVANGADINQKVPRMFEVTVLRQACMVRNANFFSFGLDLI